ncbi:class II aldolase/adducin family protein [Athalassotoga saccharophila]|uniref:class II aldolase/adducin family protein n=1 Tax=Athalassotoga saccharophila TaxID=1441386 RepID=UPI0013794494|nr:class II aldolase/adducin family protein [Athalassotoga saccharophila]BBJ27729.1 L-fuculose phosphate aldolase [Athalassotoga saccharophila]
MKESIILLDACQEIMDLRLVSGTWGNLSLRLENGNILITPSGIPYDAIREDDLVICDRSGNVVEGNLPPSSELKMHVAIYSSRKDVNAIVHTHSLYASIASAIFDEVQLLVEDVAMVIGGRIRVTSYRYPGTQELADEVVKALGDRMAAIIANHGQVAVGPTMDDALLAAQMCEKASEMYVIASQYPKVNALPDSDVRSLYDKYVNSYKKLRDLK